MIILTFYSGLIYSTMMTLDAAFRGALMNIPQDVTHNLIEEMAKTTTHGEVCNKFPLSLLPKLVVFMRLMSLIA